MPDPVISDNLEVIDQALKMIALRFKGIESAETFIQSEEGTTLLDAISMRLQVIGEKVKRIEKHAPGIFQRYNIDSSVIIRFRDFISHNYENVDHEIIFNTCKNDLPDLHRKIVLMMRA